MHAIANIHDAVEGKPGFGMVAGDDLLDCVLVAEAVEHGPLTMIRILQSKRPAKDKDWRERSDVGVLKVSLLTAVIINSHLVNFQNCGP